MSKIDTSSKFISYTLTEGERQVGSILSPLNKMIIQNLIHDCAEEKVAMDYDPNEPEKFLQREAELKGQIGILQHLLSLSAEAEFQSSLPSDPER